MVRIRKNTVRISGFIALFCLSLACFTYINSIRLETQKPPETIYVEEISPEDNTVIPDVDLIKRLVRKAFEFMSMTNL
jgi:hypothetical protein